MRRLVPAAEGIGASILFASDSWNSLGPNLSGANLTWSGTGAWPAANRALYVPFTVPETYNAQKMFVYNGTHSGNADIGIYDESWNRLVSTGSTASSGDGALQEFDITDTLLYRGRYYFGLAFDNGTVTIRRVTTGAAALCSAWGMAQQATAFALPSTAIPAIISSDYIPLVGIAGRTLVT